MPVTRQKIRDLYTLEVKFNLSLARLCLGGFLSSEIALFVVRVASLDDQVICDRESAISVTLCKYINTLLKS